MATMDFCFDLNQIFPSELVEVGSDLLPTDGLPRDSPLLANRQLGLAQQRVIEIIDCMGEGSAVAQDLKAPITTGTRVRNHPEHSVYLLLDLSAGRRGSVVGMLKVGKKNLFLLDRGGEQNEVYPPCILDFYVHESRQRSGIRDDNI